MILNDVISNARRLTQDTGLLRTPDAYVTETLLAYANQTLKQTAILRPDLFAYSTTTLATVADTPLQSMPTDSSRLIEIFYVADDGAGSLGGAIEEVDRDLFARSYPDWVTSASGVPVKYMRHPRSPNKYFLYPRPAANVELAAEYAKSPPTYDGTTPVELLPDAYFPAIVHGVAALIEKTNASMPGFPSSSERATMFEKSYAELLGVTLDARALTDVENAAVATQRQPQR